MPKYEGGKGLSEADAMCLKVRRGGQGLKIFTAANTRKHKLATRQMGISRSNRRLRLISHSRRLEARLNCFCSFANSASGSRPGRTRCP